MGTGRRTLSRAENSFQFFQFDTLGSGFYILLRFCSTFSPDYSHCRRRFQPDVTVILHPLKGLLEERRTISISLAERTPYGSHLRQITQS